MASSVRCSQIIGGRLIVIRMIHRQTSQLTNYSRILSVVPVYSQNKQRYFHNWNYKLNGNKSINSSNIFQLISIGCASILVYNYYKRWVQCSLFKGFQKKRKKEMIYWFVQNSICDYLIPTLNADAGNEPKNTNKTVDGETSDDEAVTDDQQAKKKSKKEKIGFRDRKVRLCQFFIEIIAIKLLLLGKWFWLFYLSIFRRDHITHTHTQQFFFNFIFYVFHVHDLE